MFSGWPLFRRIFSLVGFCPSIFLLPMFFLARLFCGLQQQIMIALSTWAEFVAGHKAAGCAGIGHNLIFLFVMSTLTTYQLHTTAKPCGLPHQVLSAAIEIMCRFYDPEFWPKHFFVTVSPSPTGPNTTSFVKFWRLPKMPTSGSQLNVVTLVK